MKKRIARFFALVIFLNIFPVYSTSVANALSTSIYESFSGTNSTNINSTGSSDSVGFTSNWSMVNAYKNPGPMTGASAVYRNTYSSLFKFPSNSFYTFPASNTAASSAADTWNVFYSARQISSAINFDSNGDFYLSFLLYSPSPGGNWGSNVVGILNGLPTSTNDASKNAIFVGRTYSGAPTVHLTTANMAVWNSTPYSATGAANNPSGPDGKSWFVVTKISTVSSRSDRIQLKFYASTDTLPSTDSGITWDVTYTGTIAGNYNYLSVQTEHNGSIDELRGGSTYSAVSGVAVAASLGTPTVSGLVYKGIYTTITITVGASGYIRFFLNGKRIPGCITRNTSGSAPNFTVTCNWKPPVKGSQRINATFTSTDNSYLGGTTPAATFQVLPRTNTR